MGQALLQAEIEAEQAGTEPRLRYVLGRNEQAMVHSAAAYARQKDRLQAWAVTASIGPGSTNMLTGAALATINRLPVLLLPSDTFATRVSAPVLQDLELPHDNEVTVNDAFKPLSRFFDRVWRPEQLPSALLGAMRVLTDPGRDRRGHHRPAAGRAGRGVRLAGIAVRRTDLACGPPAAGALGDRPGRRDHRVGAAPADRGGRRRDLLRRQRRASSAASTRPTSAWSTSPATAIHMGGNMSEIIRAAGNKLRLVHVADTMDHHRSHGLRYITNPPGNPARVHQHLKIGDGDVDWDEFFGGLAEIDFYDRPDTVMVSSVFAEDENAHEVSRYQLATMTDYVIKYTK